MEIREISLEPSMGPDSGSNRGVSKDQAGIIDGGDSFPFYLHFHIIQGLIVRGRAAIPVMDVLAALSPFLSSLAMVNKMFFFIGISPHRRPGSVIRLRRLDKHSCSTFAASHRQG